MIDFHAHLTNDLLFSQISDVIQDAANNGITIIIDASDSRLSIQRSISLSDKYDCVFSAIGISPQNAHELAGFNIRECTKHNKVIAIGEIGLNRVDGRDDMHIQAKVFEEQIRLANEVKLPIVVHNRDSNDYLMEIIDRTPPDKGGILHHFKGDLPFAKWALDHKFYISFSGAITYSKRLQRICGELPIDCLLAETDSPAYVAPLPMKGNINKPSYVRFVYQTISEIHRIRAPDLEIALKQNAKRIFNI